ncbi:MAG: noncanonical pyrimidine nucleotidase, YjjG family [Flavobacterium sp.]|nr:MAG: noncanonical pyrimidine nucleotidase, YjjG family [Flavobacterium sp.]
MITDVFFDLDHTLWDFDRNSELAFEKVLAKQGIDVDLDDFLLHYIPLNLKYWEKYRNDEVSQAELRYRRLKDTFDALDFHVDDSVIDQLSDDYIFHLPEHNHLLDGAIEILDYLSAKYRLHIITNGFHEVQHRKIEGAKIGHYFLTITNSEMAGVKKPNPLIFEHALKLADVKKENAVMIGDCIDADVRGAISFGMDAILLGEYPTEGIKQVSRLIDLKKYL